MTSGDVAPRDAAVRVLDLAVRLLPASRVDWGRAMRSELDGIESGPDRRRFAIGCLRAIATQRPADIIGYPVLVAIVFVAVVALTAHIRYTPLRVGLIALTAILVAVSWLGRRRGRLGPVAGDRLPRLVRAGGYLLVGATVLGLVLSMRAAGNPEEKAMVGVPVYAVMLTCYLVGFLAITARHSPAAGRVLAAGVGSGTAAAVVWLALVLLAPPVPASTGPALDLIVVAAGVAAFANVRRPGGTERVLLAALTAGTVGALVVVTMVALLADYGPASLIPDLAPAALTPAADLAQSRVELGDPYVGLLFVGCLLSTALAGVAVTTRRSGPAASGVDENVT